MHFTYLQKIVAEMAEVFQHNTFLDFMAYLKTKGYKAYVIATPDNENETEPVLSSGNMDTKTALQNLQMLAMDKSRKDSRDYEVFEVPKMNRPFEKMGNTQIIIKYKQDI